MIKDYTNAFVTPTTRKALLEASITEAYLVAHPRIRKQIMDTQDMVDGLVETYKEVLGKDGCIKAKMLNTFVREPWEYKRSFMVCALMASYRVFDKTHEKYPRLLELVQENDPEWLDAVEANHEFKLKRCQVPVYGI